MYGYIHKYTRADASKLDWTKPETNYSDYDSEENGSVSANLY